MEELLEEVNKRIGELQEVANRLRDYIDFELDECECDSPFDNCPGCKLRAKAHRLLSGDTLPYYR